jgi:MraZ protein
VDAKGRTSFPAAFREVLNTKGDARLVVTTGLDACLVAYPMSEWLAFEDRLAALPQFDRNVAMLRRIYVSGAIECEVDKVGRLLIPAGLRKHAGLGREALWAGMGRYIELWDLGTFDAMREGALAAADTRDAMAARLAELGL